MKNTTKQKNDNITSILISKAKTENQSLEINSKTEIEPTQKSRRSIKIAETWEKNTKLQYTIFTWRV